MSELFYSILGLCLSVFIVIYAVQYWAEIKEGVQTVMDLLQKTK